MARPRPLEPDALAGLTPPWALVDARVWDGRGRLAGAISFGRDGRVLACGTREEVLAALPTGAAVVDGRGVFVAPGFVDAHVHVRAAASAALSTDVSAADTAGDVLAAVSRACRDNPDWATLVGLRTPRRPHREELDRVSNGTRVRIRDRTGHGWLLNSSALEALGVDSRGASDAAPVGVLVERGDDRRPTGFVVDHIGWLRRRLGRVTPPARLAAAACEWSRSLARAGVVALCDATATNGLEEVCELYEWWLDGVLLQEPTFLAAPATAGPRVCGVKFAQADDARIPRALGGAGVVAVHCIDTRETGAVLAAAARTPRAATVTLRLEHAAFVPPDWLEVVERVGATVVTQPAFVEAHGDLYLEDGALAPHDWLYRLASWPRAAVPLAFGSDAPFGPAEPLRALRAAASRRTTLGRVLGAEEALSGEPALRAVTVEAAACSGLDRYGYGTLAPGGAGAAVVLSDDPRRPERLEELSVVGTVIGGSVVR